MTINKRKKVTKYRGHVTHGGGHRKKRRGAGSRGGRGNAGTGKRASHKKAGISRKLGGYGFTSKKISPGRAINVGYFTAVKVEKLVNAGKAVKEGEIYVINLKKLRYGKLLSTGNTKLKLKIIVASCSAGAEEKIKAAGGEVVLEETPLKSEKSSEKVEESNDSENSKEESSEEKTEAQRSETSGASKAKPST